LQPRYYQNESIDSLFDYWDSEAGNPLIDLATGAGKSFVMTGIIRRLLRGWCDMRIVVVTHVKELIEQNHQELIDEWPEAPAGIYSAGLGRRDYRAQILFGGIQTIWNKTNEIGFVDIVLIDECHLISRDADGRYGAFFAELRKVNPDLKIVGLTATPYRLDSGRLDEGEDRMFDKVIYTYSIADGVRDGYLTPLSTKETASEISTFGVKKAGKDFQKTALGKAADEITEAAVAEIVAKGRDRQSWMAFCSGKEHAYHVRDAINRHGITCEAIVDDTPKGERRDIIRAYKNYEIRCLTNNAVLTTGFNHKGVDLIAALRPTLSVSLYLQMMGRGTRAIYRTGFDEHDPKWTAEDRRQAIADGPKPTCLILDFARLVDEHGPVDSVVVSDPGSGDGEAPSKVCPPETREGAKRDKNGIFGCGEKLHASARSCKFCGYEFEFDTGPKIDSTASDKPIMSTTPPEWRYVLNRRFNLNQKGDAPNIKVSYINGKSQIYEWLGPAHKGLLHNRFKSFWHAHGGKDPLPRDALEFLDRQNELRQTQRILVTPGKGGYWNIKDYDVGAIADERSLFQKLKGDRKERPPLLDEMMDEIPF
jgi:DNA repair protein RadD